AHGDPGRNELGTDPGEASGGRVGRCTARRDETSDGRAQRGDLAVKFASSLRGPPEARADDPCSLRPPAQRKGSRSLSCGGGAATGRAGAHADGRGPGSGPGRSRGRRGEADRKASRVGAAVDPEKTRGARTRYSRVRGENYGADFSRV